MDELVKYRLNSARERLESAKILQRAFQIRNTCDYDDFFLASQADATEQYNNAIDMLEAIENYIKNMEQSK